MDKEETWKLIRVVYGWYNQVPYGDDKPFLVEGWRRLLGDFPFKDVLDRATEIASISKVMPTPGGIRRYIIDSMVGERPPSVQEAWAWLQKRNNDLSSGTWSQDTPHSVMVETMQAIGGVITGLHTNGDREYFSQVYNAKLLKYEIEMYKVKHEA